MIIIGADYHPTFQQIAFVETETGELQERRLEHREEAEKFYCELAVQGMKVRVGMEASGQARWFDRVPAELNIELWIGDATEIARKRERKQKTDRQRGIFFNVKGDAGGFGVGSQLTYQIYGGVGKEFKQKFDVLLGYRHLYVDYKNGGFLYDVHMSGLQAGFNIHFK
jgi:hypothetical protein